MDLVVARRTRIPPAAYSNRPTCSWQQLVAATGRGTSSMDLNYGVARDACGSRQAYQHHERMHRTLKAETARPPESTFKRQQQRFDRFRQHFNNERPHEALGQKRPASLYVPSPRPYPEKLPPLEYAGH